MTTSVTGDDELNLRDIEAKLGSMANTTKCCATGARTDVSAEIGPKYPTIRPRVDPRDAEALAEQYGALPKE